MLGLYPDQARKISLYYSTNTEVVTLKPLRNQSSHQSPQTLLESLASGEDEVAQIFFGVVVVVFYLNRTANFYLLFLSAAGRTLEALI